MKNGANHSDKNGNSLIATNENFDYQIAFHYRYLGLRKYFAIVSKNNMNNNVSETEPPE